MTTVLDLDLRSDEVYLLYTRYDKDNDGLLRFSDFCRMVESDDHHYQDVLKSK